MLVIYDFYSNIHVSHILRERKQINFFHLKQRKNYISLLCFRIYIFFFFGSNLKYLFFTNILKADIFLQYIWDSSKRVKAPILNKFYRKIPSHYSEFFLEFAHTILQSQYKTFLFGLWGLFLFIFICKPLLCLMPASLDKEGKFTAFTEITV